MPNIVAVYKVSSKSTEAQFCAVLGRTERDPNHIIEQTLDSTTFEAGQDEVVRRRALCTVRNACNHAEVQADLSSALATGLCWNAQPSVGARSAPVMLSR